MKKTEKQPDGTEKETHIDAGVPGWDDAVFRGEAPADRSGDVGSEIVGTVGSIIPPPTGTDPEDEEDHAERRPRT